jgi:hypothetical protein
MNTKLVYTITITQYIIPRLGLIPAEEMHRQNQLCQKSPLMLPRRNYESCRLRHYSLHQILLFKYYN